MAIPAFDQRGLLPPFMGPSATTGDRSPYFVTTVDLVRRFAINEHRRKLLRNLIDYRSLLAGEGYQEGIQFVDGSFVENVEMNQNRSPGDIDVFSFLNLPQKYLSDPNLWIECGSALWQDEIINRRKNKERFAIDSYAVLIEELGFDQLLQQTIYWYSLFSHQRETFAWKGFAAIRLDPASDKAALAELDSA